MTGFKSRVGLRGIKRHDKVASADLVTAAKERERVQELIKKSGYTLQDIYNMDEIGFFYIYIF